LAGAFPNSTITKSTLWAQYSIHLSDPNLSMVVDLFTAEGEGVRSSRLEWALGLPPPADAIPPHDVERVEDVLSLSMRIRDR
jgi:hypothetical protein